MQYEADTPAEYLRLLEDDWRRAKLEQLRVLIRKNAPGYEECIRYKMLGYRKGEQFIFQLNAPKKAT